MVSCCKYCICMKRVRSGVEMTTVDKTFLDILDIVDSLGKSDLEVSV